MNHRLATTMAAFVLLGTSATLTLAQNTATTYGSQLMTRQERMEYRSQMRSMKTQEERNAFRLEHHQRMQERARERGLTLPDAPPVMGGGMGPGMAGGMGPGMGGGMGRGRP